jgi:hypothetical protein
MRIDILTHFSLHNPYTEREIKEKNRDEDEKYYKTGHVYILCKKTVSKYHFSKIYPSFKLFHLPFIFLYFFGKYLLSFLPSQIILFNPHFKFKSSL